MKKAIVLGATGNIAFAAAHMIMQLNKYMYDDIDNIIVYYDNFSAQDIYLLKKLCNKCIFIEYTLRNFCQRINIKYEDIDVRSGGFGYWKHMVYSIYEMFDLLDRYNKVLWLDCDIIIRDNFNELFNYSGIAMRRGIVNMSSCINADIENDQKVFNSGVVLIDDNLKEYNLASECYNITKQQLYTLKNPDQTVLTYICYIKNIKVQELSCKYNYFVPWDDEKEDLSNVKLFHICSPEKPWNTPLYSLMFPEFQINYKRWIALGGSENLSKKQVFLKEIGITPKSYFTFCKNSIHLIDFHNEHIWKLLTDDLSCKIYIKDNIIRLFFKDNTELFYRIGIGNINRIALCQSSVTDKFSQVMREIERIFIGRKANIYQGKNCQFIEYSFSREDKGFIPFSTLLIKGTLSKLKQL